MLTIALAALAGTVVLVLIVAGLVVLGLWWRTRRANIKAHRTSGQAHPEPGPEEESTERDSRGGSTRGPERTGRAWGDEQ